MTTCATTGCSKHRGRQQRSAPRPRTMSPAALRRWHRENLESASPTAAYHRPATRGECRQLPRPCPFVGCRHHLYIEVKPTGAVTMSWPHLEPWEVPESCALDVADRDSHTLDEIGELLNLSWERIRKIERGALERLRAEHGDELAKLWPTGNQDHALEEQEQLEPSAAAADICMPIAEAGGW